MTYRVLAVIPAYNEEGKIGKVVSKIPSGVVAEVVVVDDCSTDGTSAEAQAAGATVLRHARNTGVGGAIRTGIDYARENDFDIVTILSGDDQHDPQELPLVLKPVIEDGYDFVQGSRRLDGTRIVDVSLFRRVFTWVYAIMIRLLTGFPFTDGTNGFRAFKTTIFDDGRINVWQEWLNTYELEPYLLYKAVESGLKITEAPITIYYHKEGYTKMRPIRDWWRITRPLIYLKLGIKK